MPLTRKYGDTCHSSRDRGRNRKGRSLRAQYMNPNSNYFSLISSQPQRWHHFRITYGCWAILLPGFKYWEKSAGVQRRQFCDFPKTDRCLLTVCTDLNYLKKTIDSSFVPLTASTSVPPAGKVGNTLLKLILILVILTKRIFKICLRPRYDALVGRMHFVSRNAFIFLEQPQLDEVE